MRRADEPIMRLGVVEHFALIDRTEPSRLHRSESVVIVANGQFGDRASDDLAKAVHTSGVQSLSRRALGKAEERRAKWPPASLGFDRMRFLYFYTCRPRWLRIAPTSPA
jgi:hypothetical protein